MVQVVFNQQVGQFFESLDTNVGTVVEDADFERAHVFDQMLPLGEDALCAAAAPFDGHNALRAEGAAVRATPAGEDAETA